MSEFGIVWRNAQRMCAAYKVCSECPGNLGGFRCMMSMATNPNQNAGAAKIERIITDWAAEHPERTMQDVFFEKFPDAGHDENGHVFVCPKHAQPEWGGLCSAEKPRTPELCRKCWNRPAPERWP